MVKTKIQKTPLKTVLLLSAFIFVMLACNTSGKKEKIEVFGKEIPDILQKPEVKPKDSLVVEIKKSEVTYNELSIQKSDGTCPYDSSLLAQGLVNIRQVDPSILVLLKYSTADNFMNKDVYGCLETCYLQKTVATMLAQASANLQKSHPDLRLLVYDGSRPHSIQKVLWASLPQYSPNIRKNYVADPAEGSIHNYGSAVDLTVANTSGEPLDMGTKFDFFGEMAYPKLESKLLAEGKLSQAHIDNRNLLRQAMKNAGFMPIEYEWWHFNALSRAKAKQVYQIIK